MVSKLCRIGYALSENLILQLESAPSPHPNRLELFPLYLPERALALYWLVPPPISSVGDGPLSLVSPFFPLVYPYKLLLRLSLFSSWVVSSPAWVSDLGSH